MWNSSHLLGRTTAAGRWFLVAVAINALAVGCFRHLATLDGPLHVLHGWMLGERIAGRHPGSHGLHYAVEKADPRITDAITWPVLRLAGPDAAHQALAAATLLLLGMACFAWWRSVGAHHGQGPWLVLPVIIGEPFILGFFPYLLGVAVALFAVAWSRMQRTVSVRVVLGAAAWLLACALVHRGALFLLAALMAGELLARYRGGWRWSALSMTERASLAAACITVVVAGLAGIGFLWRERIVTAAARDPFLHGLTGRPLVLVDAEREAPLLLLLAGPLVLVTIVALSERARSKDGRADGLAWAAGSLLLASLLLRSPGADLHYFVERAQWTALLFIALVLSVWSPRTRLIRWVILLVMLVHGTRLVFLEHRMAQRREPHQQLLAAIGSLSPGAVVLPVFRTTDHLRTHEAAHVMMRHDGFVLSRREPWWYRRGTPAAEWMRRHVGGRLYDPAWLRALRQGPAPLPMPEVLVIGADTSARDSSWTGLRHLFDHQCHTSHVLGAASILNCGHSL